MLDIVCVVIIEVIDDVADEIEDADNVEPD